MASSKLSSVSVADPPSFFSNLTFESCLGQGGFGTVLKAIDKNSSSSSSTFSTPSRPATAVKLIFFSASIPQEERQIMRETTLAININHENIVKILAVEKKQFNATEIETILKPVSANNSRVLNQMDVFMSQARRNENQTVDCICIQMQLCGKNLRAWLNQENDRMVQLTQIRICLGMTSGLKYLHDNKIIHRDLKPENIMFSREFALPVKIGDFGQCRNLHSAETQTGPLTSRAGTQEYMAPEAFTNDYSYQADLFSLGLVIWEVFQPIDFTERRNLFDRLVNDKEEDLVVKTLPTDVRKLVLNSTRRKKTDRVQTADEILRSLHIIAFSGGFVRTSEGLMTCLRNVQKGGLIILGEGLYEGAFVLKQDNVEIMGVGGGKTILKGLRVKARSCLKVIGSDCTISGIKVISRKRDEGIGIDIHGSRNAIRNVEASGGRTCFRVRAVGNRLENLTITDAFHGIQVIGSSNIVDHVKMQNIRCVGITFNVNSNENTISDIKFTCAKRGIWVGGSNNNFSNIALIKRNNFCGCVGIRLSHTGSNNIISNLTCSGYSSNKMDWGLRIDSSDTKVKDSCGPVWVRGKNVAFTNVDCGEEIKIGGAATSVCLTNCWGQILKVAAPKEEVTNVNCKFDKIANL